MRNSSTPPLLRLEDICVKFGFVEALKSVNLSIQRQEVIAIVGDNGAGKSTLIKVIAGFLQPGFGHIYLNGEQVTIPSIREADRMGIASASTETASMPESNGHQTTKHQTHILAYNPIFRPTPRNTAKEQKSS